MRLKIFGLFSALLLVAGCQTAPQESAEGTGSGASASTQSSSTPSTSTGAVSATPSQSTESAAPAGPAPGTQADLVYNVGDRVFFDFDKFALKAPARATLEREAAWLKANPSVRVTVEGHCDERGTREYNLALGERRAQSVKDYLVSLGIDARRVNTISYGKERPEALGHNEAAWSQNRRGVTVVN